MKKTLVMLVALALFAVPVVVQGSSPRAECIWIPILERLNGLPILGWLVGQSTPNEVSDEEPEPPSPETEDNSTLVLEPGTNEARGIWEPEG